jgi:hypothetical protein
MVNFKKIDDKDFVFINKQLTEKEEKAFSDFLKLKKTGINIKVRSKGRNSKQKETAHNA